MPQLFVRRPSPRMADGELTHLEREQVDPDLAGHQWRSYVDVYRRRGWDIVELARADDHPDGVFVEDAVVVFDDLAVLARPGALTRRGEVASMEQSIADWFDGEIATIPDPGTLEGGDVLKVGRTAYVGASSRTNSAGISALRALLEPRGWSVIEVPVTKALHLKSAVTALPDGTIIGFEPLVDDPGLFESFLAVPEPHGTAVVVLDQDTVLISADAPLTSALLRERGLTVITTPVSEFEKLEGCVTCLSVRQRD